MIFESHKKTGLHTLSRRYIFGKTTGTPLRVNSSFFWTGIRQGRLIRLYTLERINEFFIEGIFSDIVDRKYLLRLVKNT